MRLMPVKSIPNSAGKIVVTSNTAAIVMAYIVAFAGTAFKCRRSAKVGHTDRHVSQCKQLAHFDADVERDDVGHQAARGGRKFLKLGREAKTVREAQDKDRRARVRLQSPPLFKGIQIVARLMDHRNADMFGTKVREGNKLRPRRLLDEALVAIRNTVTPCDSTSACAERRE